MRPSSPPTAPDAMPPDGDAPPSPASPSAAAAVAWNWILEYLAGDEHSHFLVLAGLIRSVPGVLRGPTDGAAPARERVALRFLEECLGKGGAELPPPTTRKKGGGDSVFDVNESCEAVLCRFLQKINNLDSEEMLKGATYMHGLHQFICEKKQTLPGVFLSTGKGANFLRECFPSLMVSNGVGYRKVEDNSVSNAKESLEDNAFELKKNDAHVTTGPELFDGPMTLRNDFSEHQKHASFNVSPLDGHGDPIAAKDGAHLRRHAEMLKSSDLGTSGYQDEHANGVLRGMSSPKLHVCCNSHMTDGSKLADDMALQNHLLEHQKHFTEIALDDHVHLLDVKDDARPKMNAKTSESFELDTNSHQNELVNRSTTTVPSSVMHACLSEVRDKAHGEVSDGDGSLDLQKSKEILSMEQCKVLNLQIFLNNRLPSEDATQQGSCIMCAKGGSDQPKATRESCLGSDICFDDMGNFVCPWCFVMRARAECYDANEKFLRAIKYLLEFKNLDPTDRSNPKKSILSKNPDGLKKPSMQSCTDEDPAKEDNDESSTRTLQQKRFKEFVGNNTKSNSCPMERELQHGGYQHNVPQNSDVATNFGGLVNASNSALPVAGGNSGGNATLCAGIEPCQEIGESRELSFDNLAGGGEGSNRNGCHKNEREPHNHLQDGAAPSSSNNSYEEVAISEPFSKRRKEDVHSPEKGNTYNYKSSKKRPRRRANGVFPCGRRNNLRWTIEEEEALKEAMKKFTDNSTTVIPWTRIRKENPHSFHSTRTPSDLKDKWDNILKKEKKALMRN